MSDGSAQPSRWMGAFFSLVGVLMFLGFGAGLVARVLGSIAAPAEPTHVEGTQLLAAARTDASWVALDALEPCAYPIVPSGASTSSYRVLVGPSGAVIGLAELSDARACTDAPHEMRGTVHVRSVAELELPSDATAFLSHALGPELVVLWVDDSPHVGLGEVALWGSMAGLGLFIAWFYAAAFFARSAVVRLRPRADRPALPLFPPRPLALAKAYRASPMLAIGFFAMCTLMFGAMTASQLPAPDATAMVLVAFSGVMTLVFVVFLGVMLRSAFRARPTVQAPREAWAEVLRHEAALARGVDVGNRALAYRDPFTQSGEPERVMEIVVGANEGMPWIVDGHVLVLRAEGDAAQYVVRVDGGPFALTDAELARFSA